MKYLYLILLFSIVACTDKQDATPDIGKQPVIVTPLNDSTVLFATFGKYWCNVTKDTLYAELTRVKYTGVDTIYLNVLDPNKRVFFKKLPNFNLSKAKDTIKLYAPNLSPSNKQEFSGSLRVIRKGKPVLSGQGKLHPEIVF